MGVQQEWKKKFSERGVTQPKESHVVVPAGGSYKGKSIGEAYTSISKARGGGGGGSSPSIAELAESGQLQEEIQERKAAQEAAQKEAREQEKLAKAAEERQQRLIEAAKREEERIIQGRERPAEQAARIARITKGRKETPFVKLAEQRRKELLEEAGPEAKMAHYPQTFIKEKGTVGVISTQVEGERKDGGFWTANKEADRFRGFSSGIGASDFYINPEQPPSTSQLISSSDDSLLPGKEQAKEKTDIAKFKQEIIKFKEAEAQYFDFVSPYTKTTEKIGSALTFGFGKPKEERGWKGTAQYAIEQILNFPVSAGYLILFTGKKAELVGTGLGLTETRKSTIEELGFGAPKRTLQQFIPTSPEGLATLGTTVTFGVLKARAQIKAGRAPTVTEKINLKSKIYKPPVEETLKTATTGKRGTIQTIEKGILARKEGPVKFEYPRRQVVEKVRGKSSSSVTVSKGTIENIGRNLKVNTVQVGRNVYGTIRGGKYDIVFQKTPKGKLKVTYLEKPKVRGKFGREIESYLKEKYGYEEAIIKKTKTIDYEPEKISVQKTIGLKKTDLKQIDIGKNIEGEITYGTRIRQKLGEYKIIGKSKEFIKGRDIKKTVAGKAESKFQQMDIAGKQYEIVTTGSGKIITIREPDIKYAIQPSYKPNIKIYDYDIKVGGVEPIIEYIHRPKLVTQRKTAFASEIKYTFEQSRIKPIKLARVSFEEFKIDFQKQLYEMKGDILIDPFKLAIAKQKQVIVEAPKPHFTIYEPRTQPPISGKQLLQITQEPSRISIPPIIYQEPDIKQELPSITISPKIEREKQLQKPETRIISISQIEIKPKTEIKPKSESKTEIEIKPKTEIKPKSESKTEIEIKPKTEIKPKVEVRPQTKTTTKATSPVSTYPVIHLAYQTSKILKPHQFSMASKRARDQYSILVRRRGRFLPIGTAKTQKEAFRRGAFAVDISAAASFKIEPIGRAEPIKKSPFAFLSPRRFTRAKREPGVFVEKPRFRISTPGEKGEITAKGLFTLKQKKKTIFNIFGG